MRYLSTRGGVSNLAFKDAVLMGLATDGGLLLPEHIPEVRAHLPAWRELSYTELAKAVLGQFIDDIPAADISRLVDEAYASFDIPEVVRLVPVGDVQVLELFHGPTLAFKDVALQLLGKLFEYVLAERGEHLNILGATSGDTGSAAIAGVRGQKNIDIYIMYPFGRVSPLQELQMTTVTDDNVHCIAVDGSFDDCQSIMKDIFADVAFKERLHLGAVNSVNWARVLAQVVYYGYASLAAGMRKPASFCVPTGNFGNVFAGYVARRMGFPIERLIVATNANDILARFFATGDYERGDVHVTPTPAMDIQVASNFERYLYYHFDGDTVALRAFMDSFQRTGRASVGSPPSQEVFQAVAVDNNHTLDTVASVYRQFGYVADPHTAVGLCAALSLQRSAEDGALICAATAHPAKFPESVDEAVGEGIARHPRLDALRGLPHRSLRLPADEAAVRRVLETA